MEIRAGVPFGYGPALLGSFLLGISIIYSNGAYSEPALICVVLAILVLGWRFIVSLRGDPPANGDSTTAIGLAWVGLAGMLWIGWNDRGLIMYAQHPWATAKSAQVVMFLLLCSYLPAMLLRKVEHPAVRLVRFALFAACIVVAGMDTIKVSPTPAIDVWSVQTKASEAFSKGLNVFTAVGTPNTQPGVAGATIPYVYPPFQIYLSWIGWRLFGDVRFAMLAGVVVAGAAMRFIARRGEPLLAPTSAESLLEDAPALFLWLTPKLLFVLEQGWTDTFEITFLSLFLAAYIKRRTWLAAVMLGLTLSTKQTMVWVVPMAALMLGLTFRQWIVTAVTGVVLAFPYVIWDFKAFKFAVVDFQSLLPPRSDGLTLTNWYAKKNAEKLGGATLAFALAGTVAGVAMWRLRRSPSLFASSIALVYLVFFAFNKWAFANYYYLVAGLAALAAAASFNDPTRTASSSTADV
ncbi:MAG: hypothetical protein ABI551_07695 [Polyangiaceae bacterium]